MKPTAFIAAALAAPALLASQALAADVTVTLSGVKAGGTLYVGLQTKDQFQSSDTLGGERIEDVSAGSHTFRINGMEPGQYSLSVWHDINDNGRFDTTPEGFPIDGFAFVNGGSLMGPPSWDQVSFELTEQGKSISERVLYLGQ